MICFPLSIFLRLIALEHTGGWKEEKIVFRSRIRRSGNSYVVTIPIELVNRFLLKEGQEVLITGMTRRDLDIHGMIGIYLGIFRVIEKVYELCFEIESRKRSINELSPIARKLSEKYLASGFSVDVNGDKARLRIFFEGLRERVLKRSKNDLMEVLKDIRRELIRKGYAVLSYNLSEREKERSLIDPSSIAKFRGMLSEYVKWKWII